MRKVRTWQCRKAAGKRGETDEESEDEEREDEEVRMRNII